MTVTYLIMSDIKHLFHVVSIFGSRDETLLAIFVFLNRLRFCVRLLATLVNSSPAAEPPLRPLCLVLSIVHMSLPYMVITTCFHSVACPLLVFLSSIYTH